MRKTLLRALTLLLAAASGYLVAPMFHDDALVVAPAPVTASAAVAHSDLPAPGAAALASPPEASCNAVPVAASAPQRATVRARGHHDSVEAATFQALRSTEPSRTPADRLVDKALDAAEAGDHPRAWHFVQRALKRDASHPLAHLLSGVLAQIEGNRARAQHEYSQYLFFAPVGAHAAEVRRVMSGAQPSAAMVAVR